MQVQLLQHPEPMESRICRRGLGRHKEVRDFRWNHTSKSKLLRMTFAVQVPQLCWLEPLAVSESAPNNFFSSGRHWADPKPQHTQRSGIPTALLCPRWIPSLPNVTGLPKVLVQLCILQGTVSNLQIACPGPIYKTGMFT